MIVCFIEKSQPVVDVSADEKFYGIPIENMLTNKQYIAIENMVEKWLAYVNSNKKCQFIKDLPYEEKYASLEKIMEKSIVKRHPKALQYALDTLRVKLSLE